LSDFSLQSYINQIRDFELKQINFFNDYLDLNEKFYGIEYFFFSYYLRLNNYIFNFISKERNLVVHKIISKSPEEFFNETYPLKIDQMLSNLDKTIRLTTLEIEKFDKESNNRQLLYNYEILGDLRIQKIALLKYYSRNKKIEFIQEADLALKAYNKALIYRNQLQKRSNIAIFSPRIPDYMVIFEDFFYFDIKNKGKILTLDFKYKYIQEKFRIWEKSLPDLKFSTEPVKGMNDYYPSDLRELNWILGNIEDVMELYGYEEFETPLLEPIEIYAAKSSDELVNEQSFYIEMIKDVKLILKPELTPTLARMVAKKSQELKKPIRWYSVPRCYRYEQPQKGRRREFYQFNMDILGENKLYAELEIFNAVIDIFLEFGATSDQFQVFYNNRRFIDSVCDLILNLPKDKLQLVYKVLDKSDKMEESEFERFVLDSFQDETIVQGIFKLKESTSLEDLLNKFEDIPEEFYKSRGYVELLNFNLLLSEANITEYCTFSSSVVRGLDYYTGIVFEVFDTGKDNIRSIFGGGRYDDLLSIFSDEKISGIGFGMGVLMFSLFLKTYNLIPEEIKEKDYTDTIYIASINDNVSSYALKLARMVRGEDFPCVIDYKFKNLKNQLKKANELGVLIVLIIGPKEAENDKVSIKNMTTEEQSTIDIEDLIDKIYSIIEEYGR